MVLRIAGKRTISQLTTFDFVLLLVIGEATQQALIVDDNSITGAILIIGTLVLIDIGSAWFSKKSSLFDKLANGVPVIIIENGILMKESLDNANIEIGDVLEAARKNQSLESLNQIKYAILEKDGRISIIPKSQS